LALDLKDRLEIHELLALYGHIIDDAEWDRLGELFTEDVVFDASDFGTPVDEGLAALTARWAAYDRHPLAHHATNIVISEKDGEVRLISKGLGVGRKGRVGSVTYRDVLRRTDYGWRIAKRKAVLRKP
jgi:hypothetical protein